MLHLWFRAKKEETEMAKRNKAKGKSARNGNSPSPYTKHKKQPFFYGEGYKENYLERGILMRKGKPHYHSGKSAYLEAAE